MCTPGRVTNGNILYFMLVFSTSIIKMTHSAQ